MRLSPDQTFALTQAITAFLPQDFCGHLILFGSQVNDLARGGDIDLLLIVESEAHLHLLQEKDYQIIAKMKQQREIGDRRIDFKIISKADLKKPFFILALENSVVIYRWPD